MKKLQSVLLMGLIPFVAYGTQLCPESGSIISISTDQELRDFSTCFNNKDYTAQGVVIKLANDIDLKSIPFTPIADNQSQDEPNKYFDGTFDGNNHTIIGLTVNSPKSIFGGLFGRIGINALIQNLKLSNFNIESTYFPAYKGGLVGWQDGGTIYNVSVNGKIISLGHNIGANGGLVGEQYNGTIKLSNADVSMYLGIHATNNGGLVGIKDSGSIDSSYAKVYLITQEDSSLNGGLVGKSYGGIIANSYSTGVLLNDDGSSPFRSYYNGGLVGVVVNHGVIKNCYTNIVLQGGLEYGGLVGRTLMPAKCINSYWDIDKTQQTNSALCSDGGRSTIQMYQESNYQNWDFTKIWHFKTENNYPSLLKNP